MPSITQWPIAERDQFVPELREERLDPVRLDCLKRYPVNARGTVVGFGKRIRGAERFQLADVDVQAPEAPGRISLRLDVYLPSQVLQCDGRLLSSRPCLPCCRKSAAQQGPFARRALPVSSLLRTHPSPSRLPPLSWTTSYTAYPAPPISEWDEEGFSSCFARPCPRAAAATPPKWGDTLASVCRSMLPSPRFHRLGLRGYLLSRLPLRLLFAAARRLAHHPDDGVVDRLQVIDFSPPCYPSYGVSGCYPGGTNSR